MELTQEQIQRVENYLDARVLNYIDVRMEVLDHIISDIEQKMVNGDDFDTALILNIGKWEKELKPTSSILVGSIYQRPKVVIDKAKKNKFLWIGLFLAITLPFFSNVKIPFITEETKAALFIISAVLTVINIIFYFKMRSSKLKTTYLFLFEKYVLCYTSLLPLMLFSYSNKNTSAFLIFSLAFIVLSIFGYKLYKNHQKTETRWV